MPQWQSLFSVLREHDINVSASDMPRPVSGGDISAAWQVHTGEQPVFLKTGPDESYDLYGLPLEDITYEDSSVYGSSVSFYDAYINLQNDVDNDGFVEFIFVSKNKLICLENDFTLKWYKDVVEKETVIVCTCSCNMHVIYCIIMAHIIKLS